MRGKNAPSIESSFIPKRFEEACIGACGRQQAGTAREALTGTLDVVTLSQSPFGQSVRSLLRIEHVDGREPIPLLAREIEMGVHHAQGPGQPLLQKSVEGPSA